jgi:hypothetical protein
MIRKIWMKVLTIPKKDCSTRYIFDKVEFIAVYIRPEPGFGIRSLNQVLISF